MKADEQQQLAKDLDGRVWTLLETEPRTPEQDDEMIHADREIFDELATL